MTLLKINLKKNILIPINKKNRIISLHLKFNCKKYISHIKEFLYMKKEVKSYLKLGPHQPKCLQYLQYQQKT